MRLRETIAEIHLDRLTHNYRILKNSLAADSFFCPMVKADAYGHGDVEVSRALQAEGAQWLGVSLIEEGLRLRQNGITVRILVFAFFNSAGAAEMVRAGLTPVVNSWEQLEYVAKNLHSDVPYPIHIKFNTGMNRLGFNTSDAKKLANYFIGAKQLSVEGVCTHLLHSEDAQDPQGRTQNQIREFDIARSEFAQFKPFFHYQNSGAILKHVDPNAGGRPGLALYGVRPSAARPLSESLIDQLRPVMSLKSSLGVVRHVKKGESVSYGGNWNAQKNSIIGVVPIGYADGYSRILSNQAVVLFREQRVPVVGTVCMDYIMIDLSEAVADGNAQVGEQIVLFGEQGSAVLSAAELADLSGTVSYEVLTRVSKRVPRVYV